MLAQGLILLSGGTEQNVLSFTPPFVITEEEIDFALGALREMG
jgi:4-aminobutyrate aminotransferase-like enzyme